jgi:class 3 adenylate cyclase/CHASE2 domain-containing sensor protein
MRSFQATAFVVGAVVTAIILAGDLLGVFGWLEDWSLDLRQKHARWVEEAPGEQLRLVAIDDASLDTLGRWPWPRARVAQAVDEVRLAGAKAVAFDVLFLEPELGTEGDRALAEAIGKVRSVVAVSVREDELLDPMWDQGGGPEQLARFAEATAHGVDRDLKVILDEAGTPEPYRSRILERPASFKSLAAWLVLEREREAGRLPADFDAFVSLMLGGGVDAARMGSFGERVLLERAWKRGESWRSIARNLKPDADAEGSPQDLPPIPEIAARGALFGVVNAEPDAFDGRLRRVTPMHETDFGLVPQMGVAAALAYLDDSAGSVEADADSLSIARREQPLREGHLPLAWPSSLLSGYGRASGGDAVVSIGRLVEHADNRRLLATQRARLREVGVSLAVDSDAIGRRSVGEFERMSADGRLRDEIEKTWEFYGKDVDRTDLPPEEASQVAALREWRLLDARIRQGQAAFDETQARLSGILGGKLVFMGLTATGTMADMVSTIFGPRTPGVFGHITVADMLLNGRSLRFVPVWVSPLAVVALGLVAATVAARFGAAAGFAALVLLLAVYVGVLGVIGFDRFDVVYPMAAPITSGFASWVVATAAVAVTNQREKQRITRQFRARVSPQLVDLLAENPRALSMEGTERETAVLFGDLAGFTTISERLGGPEVVKTLNLYMGEMTRELTREHAYVNKFLGDGLMAVWSAFHPEPRQGEYAVRAAMACQRVVREIGQRPERAGLPPISLRLGIATGKVVLGDCGAPPDLNDYTVIGDSVNLASRLESANKQFGTSVLVDGRTAEAARAAGLPLCGLGRVVVVGQSVPVDVFEVCLEQAPEDRIRLTESAVALFARGDFEGARLAFEQLDRRLGHSKTAATFLEAMARPGEARDGVLHLRAK